MILVYNIFSVALLEAKLALLDVLATLAMLTWLLEELQKKYYILKSSEFNFPEGQIGLNGQVLAPAYTLSWGAKTQHACLE